MFKQLDDVQSKFESIDHQLQNPDVVKDQNKFRQLMKEHAELQKIVSVYIRYKKANQEIADNKEMLNLESDPELRAVVKEDLARLEKENEVLQEELKLLLLPKDPNDDKNIILEIRAGAGGDEASLFAEELFTGYMHYCADQSWKTELMSTSLGNAGGFKEVIALVSGDKVFSKMKFESGVHRVQRVPKTETQGRVHTSTVTVAVIPEAEEVEVKINLNEVRVDVMRASGAGGQHINTTDSAVRLTHAPTGIVVYCQDGRSQHANKDKAFKILYSRIKAQEEEKAVKEASSQRIAQIGTGDRSERIRTYNFPQSRITDHRIGLTTHAISQIMSGDFGQLIDPLVAHFQSEALKNQSENA